jgi:hypothetical protein
VVGRDQLHTASLGGLKGKSPHKQVGLDVKSVRLYISQNFADLRAKPDWLSPAQCLVLRNLMASHAMHHHSRSIVHLETRSVAGIGAGCDDVHFVTVPNKPCGKTLGKSGGSVNVGCEGVTCHDYLEFFQS